MDIKINKTTVLVFDLDDTLYNEIAYLKSAYRHIAIFLSKDDWKTLYSTMFSLYRNDKNVFDFLVENYDIDFATLIGMYRNHNPEISLFPGVLNIFKTIKAKNGKLAIITDGREKTQTAKIEALGITSFLDKIIISETLGTEKPHVANYKAIENEFSDMQYFYIADNIKKDFITPNKLGWKTIGLIDNGLNIHSNILSNFDKEYLPQHFIQSYDELNII